LWKGRGKNKVDLARRKGDPEEPQEGCAGFEERKAVEFPTEEKMEPGRTQGAIF